MMSDTIHEAIREIERYQREWSDNYGDYRDHIEIVKKVMLSLQHALDAPPHLIRPAASDCLSEDQKRWWRVCCEANVSRWVERLRLFGPIDSGGLAGVLAGAVERQEALLNEEGSSGDDASGVRVEFIGCLHVWCFLNDVKPVRRRLTKLLPKIEQDCHPLPVDYTDWLMLPCGATFADGVRAVREKLGADDGATNLRLTPSTDAG